MRSLLTVVSGFAVGALLLAGCAAQAPAPAAAAKAPEAKPVAEAPKPAEPEQQAVAKEEVKQEGPVLQADDQVKIINPYDTSSPIVSAGKLPRMDESNSVTIKAVDTSTGKEVVIQFRTIFFDFDKYLIRPEYRPIVEYNAAQLAKVPNLKVMIEGHCDERGTTEYNLALGEHRAVAVMTALNVAGVVKTRLNTVSYGKERPMDPGHSEEAWSKNRRSIVRES